MRCADSFSAQRLAMVVCSACLQILDVLGPSDAAWYAVGERVEVHWRGIHSLLQAERDTS